MSLWFLDSKSPAGHGEHSAAFHWVAHLGMPGVFAVSAVDATVVPLAIPGSTDLLLLWLIAHRGNPWALVACALTGTLLGGYTTWHLGKKGGQAAIKRYVPARLQKRVEGWGQHHPILAVFVPAILPPPIPLWPFLLAAGALGVKLPRFLMVFGAGRALRYGIVGLLAVRYGRAIVHLWSTTLDKWAMPIVATFLLLSVAGSVYGVWKFKRQSRTLGSNQGLSADAAD